MKNTFIAYLNFLLIGMLVLLLGLYVVAMIKQREFDKVFWDADIRSQVAASDKSGGAKDNMLKILSGVFYNRYDGSQKTIDYDVRNFIIHSQSSDSIYFWNDRQLLPDSLSLRYFSVDESQFYQLNAVLPYGKIKAAIKEDENGSSQSYHLVIAIEGLGKVLLQRQKMNGKRETISELHATATEGTVKELVQEKSPEGTYDLYEGIDHIADFVDILKGSYFWEFRPRLRAGEHILEAYASPYDATGTLPIMEENASVALQRIPDVIYIKWGNDRQTYGKQYYFEAGGILDAFRKLNAQPGNEPVVLSVDLSTGADFIHFVASKGDVTIALRDLYPEKVIRYSN